MSELTDLNFAEKYRPQKFEELIFLHKEALKKYLTNSKTIPSLIFHSRSPGTGKTSCAKILAKMLDSDLSVINASDERGIDTIRDKIKLFVQSLSSNPHSKRLVFLDEADGITKIAQDSLRNLMETYANNCFFILSCNDISKITEPIKSRCILFNFDSPNKNEIYDKLIDICAKENIILLDEDIKNIVEVFYPDIRGCILHLQTCLVENKKTYNPYIEFNKLIESIKQSNVQDIYTKIYEGGFDIPKFTEYFFKYIFNRYSILGLEKTSKITRLLADILKSYELNVNLEVVFLANMLEIMKVLKS